MSNNWLHEVSYKLLIGRSLISGDMLSRPKLKSVRINESVYFDIIFNTGLIKQSIEFSMLRVAMISGIRESDFNSDMRVAVLGVMSG